METRVAVISIIVEQEDAIEELNILLHEARQYIVGRMGIPYRAKGISIISIVIDAPQDTISALSGKIGHLKGPGRVIMETEIGTQALLPQPGGELLPRIC